MEGGPPVRGERVPLAQGLAHTPALIWAIQAHAGIGCEVVARPLPGVALQLPPDAEPLRTAQALDAEQVTCGFLDFQGRACVALPADVAHIEQTAHAVAKVVHLLWEVHTDFINTQSDACPLPPLDGPDPEAAAAALLGAIEQLIAAWADWRRVTAPPDELAQTVAAGLELVKELWDADASR